MPRVTALKIAIVSSGLTATEVARRIEVDPTIVSAWANGARTPRVTDALKVANVLGTTVEALFPVTEQKAAA